MNKALIKNLLREVFYLRGKKVASPKIGQIGNSGHW